METGSCVFISYFQSRMKSNMDTGSCVLSLILLVGFVFFPDYLGFLILVGFYFLPYFIAYSRKHLNREAVLVANLFLGWTFWVG